MQQHLLKDFVDQTRDANADDELVCSGGFSREICVSSRESDIRRSFDWYGRFLYGRHYASVTDVIAMATEACGREGLADQSARFVAVIAHARCALRHMALARLAVATILGFVVFVAAAVLAHETHNTHRIFQRYIDNPTVSRAPEQSWGYTPVLSGLPKPLADGLIAFDREVESVIARLGVGRNKSASRSIQSMKLGAILLSLFCLMPLIQWAQRQFDLARASREQAFEAAGIADPGS